MRPEAEKAPWEEEVESPAPAPVDYTPGKIKTAAEVKAFLLAGNATVTLASIPTSARFTYKVAPPPPMTDGRESPIKYWVHLLVAPDNERGYQYLGNIFNNGNYRRGKNSKVGEQAGGALAFAYFYNHVVILGEEPEAAKLEVWHEGRCGKCGRKLTVPESIERGIGPECYARLGGRGLIEEGEL